eukprot:m.114059 g.114059  ORF g.114059 m.114059 type:complete len:723 (+) comp9272_c0_seq12:66-2234(+)
MAYRWYFTKDELLKSKKDAADQWTPFCGHDSHALEVAYAKLQNDGELSNAVVPVLGNSYDVDLVQRKGRPTYFISEGFKVDRAVWFQKDGKTVIPIFGAESEYLEKHDKNGRRSVGEALASGVAAKAAKDKTSPQFAYTCHQKGFQYIWKYDSTIEKKGSGLSWASSTIFRGYGQHLNGVENSNVNVYEESCMCGDVSQVAFVIHGIGQKLDQSIEKEAFTVTHHFQQLAAKGFFGSEYKHGIKRVEFVPVQWRAHLDLNDETLAACYSRGAAKISKITDVLMDVLYFMSPMYSQDLMDAVAFQLNSTYEKFLVRHPNYLKRNGQFSIFAHSLGSVLAYELVLQQDLYRENVADAEVEGIERFSSALREQFNIRRREQVEINSQEAEDTAQLLYSKKVDVENAEESDEFEVIDESKVPTTKTKPTRAKPFPSFLVYPKLQFHVKNLLMIGSPVGLFLSLRGVGIGKGTRDIILPKETRLFNIYHELDPISCRLEPLYEKDPDEAFKIPKWNKSLYEKTLNYFQKLKRSAPSFKSKPKELPTTSSSKLMSASINETFSATTLLFPSVPTSSSSSKNLPPRPPPPQPILANSTTTAVSTIPSATTSALSSSSSWWNVIQKSLSTTANNETLPLDTRNDDEIEEDDDNVELSDDVGHLFKSYPIDFDRTDFVKEPSSSISLSEIGDLVSSHGSYWNSHHVLKLVFGILTFSDEDLASAQEAERDG